MGADRGDERKRDELDGLKFGLWVAAITALGFGVAAVAEGLPDSPRVLRSGLAVSFLLYLIFIPAWWLYRGSTIFSVLAWAVPLWALIFVILPRFPSPAAAALLYTAAICGVAFISVTSTGAGFWSRWTSRVRERVFEISLASDERAFYRAFWDTYRRASGAGSRSDAEEAEALSSQIGALEALVPPSAEWADLRDAAVAAARFFRAALTGEGPRDTAEFETLMDRRDRILRRLQRRSRAWRILSWTPGRGQAESEA